MKKLLALVLAVTCVLSLAACGSEPAPEAEAPNENNEAEAPAEGEGEAEEEAAPEGEEILYMGTEAGFAPYEYISGSDVVGVDVDIANAIAEELGKKLEIKNMDFDGALNYVAQGKVDFVAAAVSVTPERAEVMDFSKNYVDSTVVAVVKKDSEKVKSNADINGLIVGVQQGNTTGDWVTENCPDSKMNLYTKFVQAAEDLKNDKIDVIVMDNLPAEELVAANDTLMILEDEPLFSEQYAIAVKKGNEELLNVINSVIEKLIEDGKIAEFIANHTAK